MPDIFNLIDFQILSIMILAIIIFTCFNRGETASIQQKLFLIIIATIIVSITLEILTYTFSSHSYLIVYLSTLVNYILIPMILFTWTLYVYMIVNTARPNLKLFAFYSSIPFAFNTIMILINPLTGHYFTISKDFVLTRGTIYYFLFLICTIYMLASLFLIIKYRHPTHSSTTRSLLLFTISPMIGAVLQAFNLGTFFIIMSLTFGAVIIYLNIQNNVLDIDFLTKALNRRALENRLQEKIESRYKNDFSSFMIDIDAFKSINDTYGHIAGDEALKNAVTILKNVFGKKSHIGRYGGDEFVIIYPEIADMNSIFKRIKSELDKFNKASDSYNLNFSVGGANYYHDDNLSTEEYLHLLDSNMYKVKAANHLKRRKNDK